MTWLLMAVVVAAVLGVGLWWQGRAQAAPMVRPPPSVPETTPPEQVEAALAPYRAALEKTRRPVARIALEAMATDDATVSKVGGRAWWPAGQPAPTSDQGMTLVLLAQLNFAELPDMPGYPRTGLLQFFIALDDYYGAGFDGPGEEDGLAEQRGFRVMYWPDISGPSEPLSPPIKRADDYSPHDPRVPRRMRFQLDSEPLSAADHRFHALMGGDAFAAFDAWSRERGLSRAQSDQLYNDVYATLDGAGHKLGGYPSFTQEDPRRSDRFELLLQLDSDDQMMWGDSGVGGFFIAPGDLARADFSRVLYTWDCY